MAKIVYDTAEQADTLTKRKVRARAKDRHLTAVAAIAVAILIVAVGSIWIVFFRVQKTTPTEQASNGTPTTALSPVTTDAQSGAADSQGFIGSDMPTYIDIGGGNSMSTNQNSQSNGIVSTGGATGAPSGNSSAAGGPKQGAQTGGTGGKTTGTGTTGTGTTNSNVAANTNTATGNSSQTSGNTNSNTDTSVTGETPPGGAQGNTNTTNSNTNQPSGNSNTDPDQQPPDGSSDGVLCVNEQGEIILLQHTNSCN